jgi:hypothetical protein
LFRARVVRRGLRVGNLIARRGIGGEFAFNGLRRECGTFGRLRRTRNAYFFLKGTHFAANDCRFRSARHAESGFAAEDRATRHGAFRRTCDRNSRTRSLCSHQRAQSRLRTQLGALRRRHLVPVVVKLFGSLRTLVGHARRKPACHQPLQ